jgi:hypothetical protein
MYTFCKSEHPSCLRQGHTTIVITVVSNYKAPPICQNTKLHQSINPSNHNHHHHHRMRSLTFLPFFFAMSVFAELQYTDFPHLIVPLDSSNPTKAFGTQKGGLVGYGVSTEISFDVRADIPANICRLNFHLNTNPAKNAPWALSGATPFEITVSRLQPTINKDKDTWNFHPKVNEYVATFAVSRDGSVSVQDGWFECPKGDVAQFMLSTSAGRGSSLSWFELNYGWDIGGPHGVTLEMHT